MEKQIIIQENNFDKARKLIRENQGKEIVFSSDDDEISRKILEKENISILLLNQEGRKDFHKQRNSGLNQVLAKLAKKKNIAIGINLDELITSTEKEKSAILARVIQNIKICRKSKLKMKFIQKSQKRNLIDVKSLGLTLGMPTNMIKDL
jgi:RNase P/RNase MRP subunit p30